MDELEAEDCTAPDPPPCEWCGRTPICAPDCMGIAVLLGMDAGAVITDQKPQQCDDCGEIAELRPYGPGGSMVCYECGQKDPEGTSRRFAERVDGR
jgi:hypothetical protein